MREIERRCDHCKTYYTYVASGWCDEKHNGDARHCVDCKNAVNDALSRIPCRYKERFRPIAEIERLKHITVETLLEWEKQNDEDNRGKLIGRRVFAGLIDQDTKQYQNVRLVRGRDKYSMYNFKLATWKPWKKSQSIIKSIFGNKREAEIEVQMEFDLVKDEWTGNIW